MTRPMLKGECLTARYAPRAIFADLNFDVSAGEVLLVTGPNGSGKTTFLNCITGFRRPDEGRLSISVEGTTENFRFSGAGLGRWRFAKFGPRQIAELGIRRTWQIPRLFAGVSVSDHFKLVQGLKRVDGSPGPNYERAPHGAEWDEFSSLLSSLNLQVDTDVQRLSFGRQKLVQFALAYCGATAAMILDEPFSGLDHDASKLLRIAIENIKIRRNRAMVIVEHPSNVAKFAGFVDNVIELEGSEVRPHATAAMRSGVFLQGKYASRRSQLYRSLDAAGLRVVRETRESGALFTELSSDGSSDLPGADRPGLNPSRASSQAGAADSRNELRQRLAALWNYLHSLRPTTRVVMIEAPNGWGKTTFFRAISRRTDRRVSLPAKLDAVPGPLGALTVRFLPVFGSGIHQVRVRALLRLVGSRMFPEIAHLADRRVGTLSGGELKRIELVATLGLGSKHLFLLDEPTNALDQKGIEFSTTLMQVSSEHGIVVAAEPYIRGG